MATFKPGDRVMSGPLIYKREVEFGDYGSKLCEYDFAHTTNGDGVGPDGAGYGEFYPWHDALPAVAALLTDSEFAVAVAESIDALQQWIDGLLDNGTAADIDSAAGLSSSQQFMARLAAALEGN